MRAISWNEAGSRFYEVGVDRGVLYPGMGAGVPWNGLVSVEETASGGDVTPYYFDGDKYWDGQAGEDFEGSIQAYTYPDEFEECDGSRLLVPGLFATRQPRKQFGLCYRSFIGSDVQKAGNDYKLHLVYNALAQPATKTRSTLTETIAPFAFQWVITAVPPAAATYKPTAHLVIDSRDVDRDKLETLEAFLYGQLPDPVIIDGGTPSYTSPDVLDGGTPTLSSYGAVDGGLANSSMTIPAALPPQADVVAFLS